MVKLRQGTKVYLSTVKNRWPPFMRWFLRSLGVTVVAVISNRCPALSQPNPAYAAPFGIFRSQYWIGSALLSEVPAYGAVTMKAGPLGGFWIRERIRENLSNWLWTIRFAAHFVSSTEI